MPELRVDALPARIRSEPEAAVLDRYPLSAVLCCADTPKDVGVTISRYAARRGAVFAIASAGLEEVAWGPIVTPTDPSYAAWARVREAPSDSSGKPLECSFGPTNSFVASALARDLIHVLLGDVAPSLRAQVTYNFRTLRVTRLEMAE